LLKILDTIVLKFLFEHREMMKTIENRDLPQLEKLIVKHLTISKNNYMSQLKGIVAT